MARRQTQMEKHWIAYEKAHENFYWAVSMGHDFYNELNDAEQLVYLDELLAACTRRGNHRSCNKMINYSDRELEIHERAWDDFETLLKKRKIPARVVTSMQTTGRSDL